MPYPLRSLLATAVIAVAGPASAVTFIDFEGVGDLQPVGSHYAAQGVVFGDHAFAVVDSDVGGSGDFANEPSPSTVLYFDQDAAVLTVAAGFDTGFSFLYAARSFAGSVTLYDNNGQSIGNAILPKLGGGPGDPTGSDFGKWATVSIALSCAGQPNCKAYKVVFGGQPYQVLYDNITFGSLTPGPGVTPPPVPEPASWALMALGMAGVLATKRRRA